MFDELASGLAILHTHYYTFSYTVKCVEEGGLLLPTNLALDDRLIDEARRIGRHRTKKEAVTAALEEYIQRRRQQRILDLVGEIDYDADYDYKAPRLRRSKH